MARAPQVPPPQAPSTQDDGVVLNKWIGLKNTLTPERLNGQELQTAINIDIDDSGQVHRRRGRKLAAAGNWSNLFESHDGSILAVKDGSLGIVHPDYSFHAIASGFVTDPIAWAEVGPTVYFSSRTRSGKVRLSDLTLAAWGTTPDLWLSPVVNPTPTLPAIAGKLLGKPPLATALAYYNGRIYLAEGRTLWCTELYTYDYVDKTRTFWQFEAPITMLGAVADGLYVGTTEGLWWMSGPWIKEMARKRVVDSGVIPGSATYIPGELGNPGIFNVETGLREDTGVQPSVACLTVAGFVGMQEGGKVYNFTENRVIFPDAVVATAMFRRQDGINQYVATLDSRGGPSSGARIGDYADAILIRGNARWLTAQSCVKVQDTASYTFIPG